MPSLEDLRASRYRELESSLAIDSGYLGELSRVSALSDYFYECLKRNETLISSGDLFRRYAGNEIRQSLRDLSLLDQSLDQSLDQPLDQRDDAFDDSLRRVRSHEMARIIFRDLTSRADLIETTRDLSELADTCIQAALDFHYRQNVARYGKPLGRSGKVQQMCVLALGKLGAYELNVSSDIDLVFFYDESGQTDGAAGISNQEFFVRVSRQIIHSLDTTTASGFVFRVDMRLRPYGDSSAIIHNRAAMEKYFIEQGRDWERYAFIKARASAGDIALGQDFLEWLRPFVYRKHLDYGAIDALREMKRLINNEVERRGLENDLKLGSGGIREVEFIVQSQQLIWGGNEPHLQESRLLVALGELEQGGYLPAEEASNLRLAYFFLRNSEHAIQAEQDRQSQRLPDHVLGQQRLADALGFDTYDHYLTRLRVHRDHVGSCFSKITGVKPDAAGTLVIADPWLAVWRDPLADDSINLLSHHGFSDARAVADQLFKFKEDSKELQEIGEHRLARILPILIRICTDEKHPSTTLLRLLPIINAVKRRSTYLVFLHENMDAVKRLVELCAMSPWIAERITDHPVLMYELTDRRSDSERMERGDLKSDLEAVLFLLTRGDFEGQMDTLRRFKHAAVLKVAVFELLDLLPTMRASDHLTKIAEVMLDKATDLAFDYLINRHGEPCDVQGNPQGRCLAIVAYGKLGGIELAYGSDLDIVFLHGADIRGQTNGDNVIPNNVFFSRLGQRIIHILSSRTQFGLLYEVDLRLRPDGNKGPMVGTFNAYERYLMNEAWTWERQALVRARYVAGNERLKEKFERIRHHVLAQVRDKDQLRSDVTNMRTKMRKHLAGEVTHEKAADEVLLSGFDLKQGAGAIVDVEFLVQYLVLANCHQHPELTVWTDKARLLSTLADLNLLHADDAKLLHQAYIAYRSAVHYDWLGGQMASHEQLKTYLARVVQIWNKEFVVE